MDHPHLLQPTLHIVSVRVIPYQKKFVVQVTVTDNLGATGTDSLIISINNTPPNVTITSPVNNSTYRVGQVLPIHLLLLFQMQNTHPLTLRMYGKQHSGITIIYI